MFPFLRRAPAGFPRPSTSRRTFSPQWRSVTPGLLTLLGLTGLSASAASAFHDPEADANRLPTVPPGFTVRFFAREPLVRQPCSMAFDRQGRLCVGMGPQYRNPTPETPGDSVVLVLDDDGDGQADRTKTFATGFNAIQGLAWHGRDLWVANAPDLTVVRDLNGDDQADEYVRVYTDLGNLEHGLHGLHWGPDGKLTMSKGNSKGLTQPGRMAPRAFRDLWGVTAPPGTPDFPPPQTYSPGEYRHAYHDPNDDWGLEGGVLRCDDGGANLEIIARGFRNPWDIAFDSGFDWLGTDNDQTGGDRVFSVIPGGQFGWNHPWNAQWADAPDGPAAPVSGPLFEGSGTGVTFHDTPAFPASHRGVFFVNDWMSKATYLWRPAWEGALLRPAGGAWEPFVQGGPALFRPTDLETGPDGALWILGWSRGYGAEWKDGEITNEGRIFRVTWNDAPQPDRNAWKRRASDDPGTVDECLADFDGPLPVWRSAAQDSLLKRGPAIKPRLREVLGAGGLTPFPFRETWTAWTLGRLDVNDPQIATWLQAWIRGDDGASLNLRIQSVRVTAHRIRARQLNEGLPPEVHQLLADPEPRLRRAAVEAILETNHRGSLASLVEALGRESDRVVFYQGWQALRRLATPDELRSHLAHPTRGIRRGALLALLEDHRLSREAVGSLERDADPAVAAIATEWLRKAGAGGESRVLRGRPLAGASPQRDSSSSPNPAPAESAAREPEPIPSLMRNLKARSGGKYATRPDGLRAGARPYSDRAYTLKRVPPALEGAELLQTANEDDGSSGTDFLTFEALFPLRVHVGLDTRTPAGEVPVWLTKEFRSGAHEIAGDHWTFEVHTRDVPAGPVRLGGNTENGLDGGKGNYLVALELLPRPSPKSPTRLDDALARIGPGSSSEERGAILFHHRSGPGCHNCHRVENHGNAFGPDLNGIGLRAEARHIAQSMVDPNAVITEGFQSHVLETADGEVSGILLEESGLGVTIGLATGQKVTVPRRDLRSHRITRTSAMPAYAEVLTAEDIADLTSYLLARRTATTTNATTTGAKPGPAPTPLAAGNDVPAGLGFRTKVLPERLVIEHSGRPVAHYVFRDDRILRPYLAHLHAPDGTRVSRNHPPVAGTDATDHDTMHPGVWLGFGDLSGEDFWRNRGTVRHESITEGPFTREGVLEFTTANSLVRRTGEVLARQVSHLRFHASPEAYRIDWEVSFTPSLEGFVFGDQEEMGLGARVATALTEKNGGLITSSAGDKTASGTWGRAYDWCDYSGRTGDRFAGITLMADPANFRPSWWHNRDYGVFVANPFGREAMKQGARSAVEVRRGETFRLRFGVVLHSTAALEPAAYQPSRSYREFVGSRPGHQP